jgi:hypothetical protein
LAIDAKKFTEPSWHGSVPFRGEGTAEPKMTDIDRLQTLASVCVKAAHNVEDTEVAAMLLETAQRFLERTNPQLALPRIDIQELNRRQLCAGFQH